MIVNGLIISSGYSERMGQPKPLMMYKGFPFAVQIIDKLLQVCEKIFVVVGHDADTVKTAVERYLTEPPLVSKQLMPFVEFVYNENYSQGMFTSLQAGLKAMNKCDHVIYHFVDQPMLPEMFYIDFAAQKDFSIDWVQPQYHELKGHPILINSSLFKIIIDSPADSNLRELANTLNIKKKYWKCGYPEVLQDIDTEEDYKSITE